jgi:hypothetical protein
MSCNSKYLNIYNQIINREKRKEKREKRKEKREKRKRKKNN